DRNVTGVQTCALPISSSTAHLVVLNLNQVLFYPEGYGSDDLTYTATLRLPAGWKFATALPVAKEAATINFKPVSLTTFVDSPIKIGRASCRERVYIAV